MSGYKEVGYKLTWITDGEEKSEITCSEYLARQRYRDIEIFMEIGRGASYIKLENLQTGKVMKERKK